MGTEGRRAFRRPGRAEGESSGAWFWDSAELMMPRARVTVSLRLDEGVITYFKRDGLRGYTARRIAVLKTSIAAT